MSVVIRVNKDGRIYIKGIKKTDQTLPAAGGHPIYWDDARGRVQFALTDHTTCFEVDSGGNIYLPHDILPNQALTFAGNANECNSDGSKLWLNIKSVRVLEVSGGWLYLHEEIIENAEPVFLL